MDYSTDPVANKVWQTIAKIESKNRNMFGGSVGEAVGTTIAITLAVVRGADPDEYATKYLKEHGYGENEG